MIDLSIIVEYCNPAGYPEPHRTGHACPLKSPGSVRVSVEKKNTGSGARYDLKPRPKPAISDISIFQSTFTILNWYLLVPR